jgi:hypothetical protein
MVHPVEVNFYKISFLFLIKQPTIFFENPRVTNTKMLFGFSDPLDDYRMKHAKEMSAYMLDRHRISNFL